MADRFTDLGQGSVANQGHPQLIVDAAIAIGIGDMNLIYGGRVANNQNGGTLTDIYGTFTVTTTGNDHQNSFLTFTMNSGYVLAGIALHAGRGSSDEFWSADDLTSGVLDGPFSNGHGLSNFDVLVETAPTSVPDGGTTVMLLGAALGSLGMARRFLKK
jgi:hypothetical protein